MEQSLYPEKSCQTCIRGKTTYPNTLCTDCMFNNLSQWEPNEETVKAYVMKCLPGEANVSVTNATNYDVINKPKHYMLFEEEGIEVRDVIERLLYKMRVTTSLSMPALFESDYVQLMQYLMRFMDKNGKEDLKKARWYLDKLIEAY